jgi:hypothetical protein
MLQKLDRPEFYNAWLNHEAIQIHLSTLIAREVAQKFNNFLKVAQIFLVEATWNRIATFCKLVTSHAFPSRVGRKHDTFEFPMF